MKVILQRVSRASVEVEHQIVGAIQSGLLVLAGFGKEDNSQKLAAMAQKIVTLRIFSNDLKKFDKSLLDSGGEILIVPQFTLFADTAKGRRPEFFQALEPTLAARYFDEFSEALAQLGVSKVAKGIFGAHMLVSLENDGPVTIPLEN